MSNTRSPSVLREFLEGEASGGIVLMGAAALALIVANSPPEMRNRIMGVLAMCIGMQPLGVLALGVLAEQLGPQNGTLITGGTGLLIVAACVLIWPEMRRSRKA